MNADRFEDFITQLLQHIQGDSSFIMDNAPAHNQAHNIQVPHGIRVIKLPPYSPFLNIVENCFSVWKAALKRDLERERNNLLRQNCQQRMATLTMLAEIAITEVTVEKAAAFFRHLQSYISGCFNEENIYH